MSKVDHDRGALISPSLYDVEIEIEDIIPVERVQFYKSIISIMERSLAETEEEKKCIHEAVKKIPRKPNYGKLRFDTIRNFYTVISNLLLAIERRKPRNFYCNTELYKKIEADLCELIRILVKTKSGMKRVCESEFLSPSALIIAACHDFLQMMKLTIDQIGFTSHQKLKYHDHEGNTLLHLAMKNQSTAVIGYILSGKDGLLALEENNNNGETPLHLIPDEDHFINIIKFLLRNKEGRTLIRDGCIIPRETPFSIETAHNKEDKEIIHGRTPLLIAAERGFAKAVKFLFSTKEGKESVYRMASNGQMPLAAAVRKNNFDVIKVLLENLRPQDMYGVPFFKRIPFDYVCFFAYTKGSNEIYKISLLRVAVSNGAADVVRLLLTHETIKNMIIDCGHEQYRDLSWSDSLWVPNHFLNVLKYECFEYYLPKFYREEDSDNISYWRLRLENIRVLETIFGIAVKRGFIDIGVQLWMHISKESQKQLQDDINKALIYYAKHPDGDVLEYKEEARQYEKHFKLILKRAAECLALSADPFALLLDSPRQSSIGGETPPVKTLWTVLESKASPTQKEKQIDSFVSSGTDLLVQDEKKQLPIDVALQQFTRNQLEAGVVLKLQEATQRQTTKEEDAFMEIMWQSSDAKAYASHFQQPRVAAPVSSSIIPKQMSLEQKKYQINVFLELVKQLLSKKFIMSVAIGEEWLAKIMSTSTTVMRTALKSGASALLPGIGGPLAEGAFCLAEKFNNRRQVTLNRRYALGITNIEELATLIKLLQAQLLYRFQDFLLSKMLWISYDMMKTFVECLLERMFQYVEQMPCFHLIDEAVRKWNEIFHDAKPKNNAQIVRAILGRKLIDLNSITKREIDQLISGPEVAFLPEVAMQMVANLLVGISSCRSNLLESSHRTNALLSYPGPDGRFRYVRTSQICNAPAVTLKAESGMVEYEGCYQEGAWTPGDYGVVCISQEEAQLRGLGKRAATDWIGSPLIERPGLTEVMRLQQQLLAAEQTAATRLDQLVAEQAAHAVTKRLAAEARIGVPAPATQRRLSCPNIFSETQGRRKHNSFAAQNIL